MPTFKCHFTATYPVAPNASAAEQLAAQISRRFNIETMDQYAAVDAIIKQIGDEYADMLYPAFRFGPTKGLTMSKQLRATLAGAGAEEE